jgi:hypothetical protein
MRIPAIKDFRGGLVALLRVFKPQRAQGAQSFFCHPASLRFAVASRELF